MSLLLALTGGTPGADNLTIAWTQDAATWGITANAKVSSAISWTQGNDTWAAIINAKASAIVAWTQQGDTWALNATGAVNSVVSWIGGTDTWTVNSVAQTNSFVSWTSQNDIWALNATAGDITDNLVISWAQDDAQWSVTSQIEVIQTKIGGDDVPRIEVWDYRTVKQKTKKHKEREITQEWLQNQIVLASKLNESDDDEEAILLLL